MSIWNSFKRWVHQKTAPQGLTGNQWGGSNFLDAYKKVRPPTPHELLLELKNTAWTCATINASVCARFAPRLYVATHTGQRQARCLRTQPSPNTIKQLRNSKSLPAYVTKASRIEEVLEHPLLTLLQKVNPIHNSYDLWELTTLYQEVVGSTYWHIIKGELGIPKEIWILPSHNVQPKRNPSSRNIVDFYAYRSGSEEQKFRPEEIIHFRYPDPKDPYCSGLPPLKACFEQTALTSEYVAMKRATFENQAIPSAIISPQEILGEEERDRIEAQWNMKFRKGGAGKVVVADSALNVNILRQSMGDLALLAEYSATKEDIVNAFHVPMAYLTKDTNLANLQAAMTQHMAMAVAPRLKRRDEKINEQLIPLYDDSGRLFVASEDPVPESQDQVRLQQEVDIKNGVKTINEVREERGYAPVEWGNYAWLPLHIKPTNDHIARQIINLDEDLTNDDNPSDPKPPKE